MRFLPGGTFWMGTDREEIVTIQEAVGLERPDPLLAEIPRHQVTVQPFFLDATDVTHREFARFVEQNPSWSKDYVLPSQHNGRYLELWTDSTPPDSLLDHPVTFVTWYAAAEFCRWQLKRLPSEAEWEFASGAGIDDRMYPWGDQPPSSDRVRWSGSPSSGTAPVGSFPPNPFGLYDMSGNVWKFLADPWSDSYASAPSSTLPFDVALNRRDPTRRVVRGGSYDANRANLRIRYRDSHRPADAREMVGFRCAQPVRPTRGEGSESAQSTRIR